MLSLSLAFLLVLASFILFEVSFSWCNAPVFLNLVVEQTVSSRIRPDSSSMCTADQVINRVVVQEEDNGMDMESLAMNMLDAFDTAANSAETVELQLPQPSFNLRNILYRTRSLPASTSGPGSSTVPIDDIEAQTDGGTATARGYAENDSSQLA